jgi:predicted esterase
MDAQVGTIYFAHGKESGPWGPKIVSLAEVAMSRGYAVESPDYSDLANPDQRVARLLENCSTQNNLILVGSSMGAYVSAVASQPLRPVGLFLMAPSFYRPGYANQNPAPSARFITIVHAWEDEVIPVETSLRFARSYPAELHLVHGTHSLAENIPFLEILFGFFLDRAAAELSS